MHAHTHTDANKNSHKRRVPDESSDLFLFWGSLGFFTGGLRFEGFSMLLGLSLSVPVRVRWGGHTEKHQLTENIYRRFRHVKKHFGISNKENRRRIDESERRMSYLRRKTWPFGSAAASPAPEDAVLHHLHGGKVHFLRMTTGATRRIKDLKWLMQSCYTIQE